VTAELCPGGVCFLVTTRLWTTGDRSNVSIVRERIGSLLVAFTALLVATLLPAGGARSSTASSRAFDATVALLASQGDDSPQGLEALFAPADDDQADANDNDDDDDDDDDDEPAGVVRPSRHDRARLAAGSRLLAARTIVPAKRSPREAHPARGPPPA
jgi:hypothetical protein